MKKIILLIILLTCSVFVSAGFDITINGKDTGIVLKPNENAEFAITIPANTIITGKEVKADNAALQTILNEYLDIKENELLETEQFLKTTMPLPATLPAGESIVELILHYNTNDESGKFKKTLNIEIEGSKAIGIISRQVSEETMHALMDTISPKPLPKLSRDLTNDDTREINLDLNEYTQVKVRTETIVEEKNIDEILENTKSEKAKKELNLLKKKEFLNIKKELNVYELTNKETQEKIKVSKIILGAFSNDNLKNVVIIENIPKEVANDVKELDFSEKPVVIEADPIVKWNVKHIAKGQEKEVSYTVKKELDSIDSQTLSAGAKHSLTARFLTWIAQFFV